MLELGQVRASGTAGSARLRTWYELPAAYRARWPNITPYCFSDAPGPLPGFKQVRLVRGWGRNKGKSVLPGNVRKPPAEEYRRCEKMRAELQRGQPGGFFTSRIFAQHGGGGVFAPGEREARAAASAEAKRQKAEKKKKTIGIAVAGVAGVGAIALLAVALRRRR